MALVATSEIVWEVQDNYQKQTYRNRYHICTDQGLHKLSVPIKHVGGKDGRQKFKDVRIGNEYSWQKQHWRTMQTAYRTSPFFEYYEDDLAPIFHKTFDYLFDFNWESILFMTSVLQIPLSNRKTISYSTQFTDGEDYRFLVNAKQETTSLINPYNQVFGDRHGFVANTSMLDLLFNEGPNTLTYIKKLSEQF